MEPRDTRRGSRVGALRQDPTWYNKGNEAARTVGGSRGQIRTLGGGEVGGEETEKAVEGHTR